MLRTSFITRFLKNYLLSIDVVKIDKICIDGSSNYKNKMVKRSLFTILYKTISYLTSNAK